MEQRAPKYCDLTEVPFSLVSQSEEMRKLLHRASVSGRPLGDFMILHLLGHLAALSVHQTEEKVHRTLCNLARKYSVIPQI